MQLTEGHLLQGGKYKIEKILGQGGFGITYLARQVNLDRDVAIKEFFMKDYCDRDESSSKVTVGSSGSRDIVAKYREKFVKEAKSIARLNHPNIVRIIDVFEENETAYYVMEYLSNNSLSRLVKKNGRFPEDEALKYIDQIASALEYIHARKMLHLDVKPANILLDEKENAVLIDFGMVKHYDSEGNQTSTTPVGVSAGYAPFEQYSMSGKTSLSPATDIYALGATLYKLLTGITPPDASTLISDPEVLSFPAYLSGQCIDSIRRSMDPVARKRPQTIREFKELLIAPLDIEDKERTVFIEEEEVTIVLPEQKKNENKEDAVTDSELKTAKHTNTKKISNRKWLIYLSLCAVITLAAFGIMHLCSSDIKVYVPENVEASYDNAILNVNGIEYPMVFVEGGAFMMGTDDSDAWNNCKPVHHVTLSSYYIGMYEVTQELWETIMGSNPSVTKGTHKPVTNITWQDCQYFIAILNKLTGQKFKLPTEAQWEFAARGGNKTKECRYSGSNNVGNVSWYDRNSGNVVHEVGLKSSNELGIYDMSGNVSELCNDWDNHYTSDPQTNPQGPQNKVFATYDRVVRGGDYLSGEIYSRVYCRSSESVNTSKSWTGFRLCL